MCWDRLSPGSRPGQVWTRGDQPTRAGGACISVCSGAGLQAPAPGTAPTQDPSNRRSSLGPVSILRAGWDFRIPRNQTDGFS